MVGKTCGGPTYTKIELLSKLCGLLFWLIFKLSCFNRDILLSKYSFKVQVLVTQTLVK